MYERLSLHRFFRSRAHLWVTVAGFVVGAVLGDRAFMIIEDTLGDVVDEIVLGLLGAALAHIGYELFAGFLPKT